MASELSLVQYLCDQMNGAGEISFRKMFGEYAIYCGGKVVALVCEDRLYVKQTLGGRSFIGSVVEAPPYAGAKPYFLIEDRLDDRNWLSDLIAATALELPLPKPKTPRVKRSGGPAKS